MDKEILDVVHKLYDDMVEVLNKVLRIFNDFYGEDRVDMQDVPDFEFFAQGLCRVTLYDIYGSGDAMLKYREFSTLDTDRLDMVKDMLHEGCMDVPVFSDPALMQFFIPICEDKIVRYALVDIPFILVHFPHVRITNENDRYVDVNNLWVKVPVNYNGTSTGYFSMNRSEYPMSHLQSGYMHSHVSLIPTDDFTQFQSPCLGSGPIRNTLTTLSVQYDEAMWRMLCLELDLYVRTESISGVPYHKLEGIGGNSGMSACETEFDMCPNLGIISTFRENRLREFITYAIENGRFTFNFINGSYGLAMPYTRFAIYVSGLFIQWYNSILDAGDSPFLTYRELLDNHIIRECVVSDGMIRISQYDSAERMRNYEGSLVCSFKGRDITLHITDFTQNHNTVVLLGPSLITCVAKAILTTVNYRYGQ